MTIGLGHYLVVAAIRYGLAEVPARDSLRRPLETPQPAGEQRCQTVTDGDGGNQRHDPGDQQTVAHERAGSGRVPQRGGEKQDRRPLVGRDRDRRLREPVVVPLDYSHR